MASFNPAITALAWALTNSLLTGLFYLSKDATKPPPEWIFKKTNHIHHPPFTTMCSFPSIQSKILPLTRTSPGLMWSGPAGVPNPIHCSHSGLFAFPLKSLLLLPQGLCTCPISLCSLSQMITGLTYSFTHVFKTHLLGDYIQKNPSPLSLLKLSSYLIIFTAFIIK